MPPKKAPAKKPASKKPAAKSGGKRKLTEYNKFMKREIPKAKADPKNKGKTHMEVFAMVAKKWSKEKK
jgi:hypothetical protein